MNGLQNSELQVNEVQLFSPTQDWFSKFDLQKNYPKGLLNPDCIHFFKCYRQLQLHNHEKQTNKHNRWERRETERGEENESFDEILNL